MWGSGHPAARHARAISEPSTPAAISTSSIVSDSETPHNAIVDASNGSSSGFVAMS
jgi:hypothetical protein